MPDSLYNPSEENKSIIVYLEHRHGTLEGVSLELLSKGRQMANQIGWSLVGLILGWQSGDLAAEAFAHGADTVLSADHRLLEHFKIEAYTLVCHQIMLERKPSVFLLGATPNGRDLAGRLAVRLRTGLNADCTGLHINPDTGVLVSEVSGFGGGVLALIEMQRHRPQMATVRPGVFSPDPPDEKRTGELITIQVDLHEEMLYTQLLKQVVGEIIDLSGTPVLIAGGRGMNGDFQILSELADLLGGDVGATRPPVDEGHIERERQIGQTGVVCAPKVAICCGISGAFHFVVGIEKADIVIAINSDPEAPIFDHADYCIVGDVHQIVPALIERLRPEREERKLTKVEI